MGRIQLSLKIQLEKELFFFDLQKYGVIHRLSLPSNHLSSGRLHGSNIEINYEGARVVQIGAALYLTGGLLRPLQCQKITPVGLNFTRTDMQEMKIERKWHGACTDGKRYMFVAGGQKLRDA